MWTFLVLSVLLHRVEKMPSVQSLVVTSREPNICEAVMALGFILISRWGEPQSDMAFISVWMQVVFPAPLGPRAIIPAPTHTSILRMFEQLIKCLASDVTPAATDK